MFEDFSKKLSVFGQQMVKKTGEVAEIASLKTKTLAKKKKIQDEMLALGKAYYEAHKDEITEFEDKITAINTMYTELECLEEELKTLKEKLPEEDIFEEEDMTGTPAEEEVCDSEETEEQAEDGAAETAADTEAEEKEPAEEPEMETADEDSAKEEPVAEEETDTAEKTAENVE